MDEGERGEEARTQLRTLCSSPQEKKVTLTRVMKLELIGLGDRWAEE